MAKNAGERKPKSDGGQTDHARKAALTLLAGVADGYSLSDQEGDLGRLPAHERARARRLATEVLRHQGRADQLLAPHLKRAPRPPVMNVLRLATVEMHALGEAPHGAVNAAVGLTRGMGAKGRAAAGMVNAVLRKVASAEGWDDLSPHQLPVWIRKPAGRAYGDPVIRAIEAAHQAGAPLDLTVKPDAKLDIPQAERLPTGSLRLRDAPQISALSGYDTGDFWVQDAAAALPVRLLDPQKGELVADLCAAPGGKTMQIAASGAKVLAVEMNPERMKRVSENLARTKLEADCITADALEWQPDTAPDAILLDAPCSATGTIRRHPDLPHLRDGTGVDEIVDLQAKLIDHALSILKPGGRLVFATCSLLPAEGEAQLEAALARNPGITVETPEIEGIAPEWWTEQGGLRLRPDYWPELGGMDGFFMARLRKPA